MTSGHLLQVWGRTGPGARGGWSAGRCWQALEVGGRLFLHRMGEELGQGSVVSQQTDLMCSVFTHSVT